MAKRRKQATGFTSKYRDYLKPSFSQKTGALYNERGVRSINTQVIRI